MEFGGRGGGQENMSEFGRVRDEAFVWSWNTRVGGNRDLGGGRMVVDMFWCNISICYAGQLDSCQMFCRDLEGLEWLVEQLIREQRVEG